MMCIHNCGDSISPRSKLNECVTCRHSLYYWRNKRPAEIVERREKLDVYASRLDTHFNTHGKTTTKLLRPKSNVIDFRTRRRA